MAFGKGGGIHLSLLCASKAFNIFLRGKARPNFDLFANTGCIIELAVKYGIIE